MLKIQVHNFAVHVGTPHSVTALVQDALHAASQKIQRIGGVASENDGVIGACTDKLGHDLPRVFVHRGADLRGETSTAVHAGVVGQDLVQVRGHFSNGWGGRRVVQIRVPYMSTLNQWRRQVMAHYGQQGSGSQGSFFQQGVAHSESFDTKDSWGTKKSALAKTAPVWPGRHPGHPTAKGGLPASKPGFCAGTRDLCTKG